MKRKLAVLLIAIIAIIYCTSFLVSFHKSIESKDSVLMTDVGNLYPVRIKKVVKEDQVKGLEEALAEAREKGLKVSIAGRQHSQGGHTYYDGAIVLDMKEFDEILNLDTERKILTVQSGATWADIQNYINPYGLSVKVMQSSNIFTVGGSLSANAHGRDLDETQLIQTVKGFRLMLANGSIVNASRMENQELFGAVIGGYGMFGIILDVDLQLVENEIYSKKTHSVDYKDFQDYFYENLYNNDKVAFMLVRPSIDPDPSSFMQDLVVFTWEKTDETQEGIYDLLNEQNIARDKFFFGLSRKYNWGKKLRWRLQKGLEGEVGKSDLVSRNNAMRPPTAPIAFLDYKSSRDTDLLQEFYIPARNFVPFMDEFRKILLEENVNVLSSTIRFVVPNNESYLSYAPKEESFAIIVMSNDKLSKEGKKKTQRVTQKLVDAAIKNDGAYYLTYNIYPTTSQIREAYPNIDFVLSLKKKYDPEEMFMSKFYERYGLEVPIDEIEKE